MLNKKSSGVLVKFLRFISTEIKTCRCSSGVQDFTASCETKVIPEVCPEAQENNSRRVLKVSVIGMPNAGKSTFINALMDRKVSDFRK